MSPEFWIPSSVLLIDAFLLFYLLETKLNFNKDRAQAEFAKGYIPTRGGRGIFS